MIVVWIMLGWLVLSVAACALYSLLRAPARRAERAERARRAAGSAVEWTDG
ncbi:hypothetical protein ACTVZO_44160 [Streptomyces sp. IBSNAI002]|uniref:hypothetical protein n=1 Tax=Streptomyces sp. IBSNAI002 TaxID=3457500 RepID=UPI003FD18ED8